MQYLSAALLVELCDKRFVCFIHEMQLPDIELVSRGGAQPQCAFSVIITPSVSSDELSSVIRDLRIGEGEFVAIVAHVRRGSWSSPSGPSFQTFEEATAVTPTDSRVHKAIDCDGAVTFFESVVRSVRTAKSTSVVVPPQAVHDIARVGGFVRAYLVPRALKSSPEELVVSHFTKLRLYGCGVYFWRPAAENDVRLTIVLNLDRLLFMDCPAVIRMALRIFKASHVKLLGRFTPPPVTQSAGEGAVSPDGESWNEVFRKQKKNCEELLQGLQKYVLSPSTTHVCTVDEATELLREDMKQQNTAVAFQRHSSALLGDSSAAHARSFVWRDENERLLKECAQNSSSVLVVL